MVIIAYQPVDARAELHVQDAADTRARERHDRASTVVPHSKSAGRGARLAEDCTVTRGDWCWSWQTVANDKPAARPGASNRRVSRQIEVCLADARNGNDSARPVVRPADISSFGDRIMPDGGGTRRPSRPCAHGARRYPSAHATALPECRGVLPEQILRPFATAGQRPPIANRLAEA